MPGLWLPEALAGIYCALCAIAYKPPYPQPSEVLREWGVDDKSADPERDQNRIARNLIRFHEQCRARQQP